MFCSRSKSITDKNDSAVTKVAKVAGFATGLLFLPAVLAEEAYSKGESHKVEDLANKVLSFVDIPRIQSEFIEKLNKHNLYNLKNNSRILLHGLNIYYIYKIFETLEQFDIVNQENFDYLFNHETKAKNIVLIIALIHDLGYKNLQSDYKEKDSCLDSNILSNLLKNAAYSESIYLCLEKMKERKFLPIDNKETSRSEDKEASRTNIHLILQLSSKAEEIAKTISLDKDFNQNKFDKLVKTYFINELPISSSVGNIICDYYCMFNSNLKITNNDSAKDSGVENTNPKSPTII